MFYVKLFSTKMKNNSKTINYNKLNNYHFQFFDATVMYEKKIRPEQIGEKKKLSVFRTKFKFVKNKRLRNKIARTMKSKFINFIIS